MRSRHAFPAVSIVIVAVLAALSCVSVASADVTVKRRADHIAGQRTLVFNLSGIDTRNVRRAALLRGSRTIRRSIPRAHILRAARRGSLRVHLPRIARPGRTRKGAASKDARSYILKLRLRKKPRPAPAPVPAPQPPPAPEPAPAPAPAPVGKATLRPVGSLALSDSVAAARVVRNGIEPRPSSLPTATVSNYTGGRFSNYPMNQTVPTDAELAIFSSHPNNQWFMDAGKITGRFTGTTDEILQWGAHKWGWDEDVVRAVAVKESNYNQGAYTWAGSNQYQGGGITSITWSQNPGSWPLGAKSTAFNLDVFLAYMRTCFDGKETWMNDTGDAGQPYGPGDMWGCVGRWYAGRWYTAEAKWYIGEIKRVIAERTWQAPGY